MDDRPRTFPPDAGDTRRWMGRLLVAVLVGEGIWNVIVSLMNNVIVPWLGDVMGQSSGLPTSFTQRPYDYPDLFVAIVELCLAGLVAVAINAFFQKPRRVKIKVQKRVVSQPSVAPAHVPVATTPTPAPAIVPRAEIPVIPVATPRPVPAEVPVIPPLVTQAPPPSAPPRVAESQPAPVVQALPPIAAPKPVSAPAPVPAAAKAVPPPPPAPPAKAKPKKVYYNSVGEPIEFDDE